MSSRKNLRNERTSGFHIPMTDADAAGYGGEMPSNPPTSEQPIVPKSLALQLREENTTLRDELEDLRQQLQSRTSSLAVMDDTLLVHDFQFTSKGMIAPDNFDPETWEHVGNLLFKLEGSLQWLIGDWLVYGVERKYGDLASFASRFGRDERTLSDYIYVASKVKMSVRTDNLSFGHHKLVTTLNPEQQAHALRVAAEQGMSVAVFRKWLNPEPATSLLTAGEEDDFERVFKAVHNKLEQYVLNEKTFDSLSPKKRLEALHQMKWFHEVLGEFLKRKDH
jgi:hypothetical protein